MHLRNYIALMLFGLFIGLHSLVGHAQLAPGDNDYKIVRDGGFLYIYSKTDANNLYDLVRLNRAINSEYKKSFDWNLDEDTAVAFLSPRNQVANAFATVIPSNLTVLYPAGADALERFAERTWREAVVVHESAHLYQLNAKSWFPSKVKSVLGTNLFIPIFPPLFIFTVPNTILPTFVLEGNATWNESRFAMGGRLFSSHLRARDLAIAREGYLDETYILNDHLDFPFGQEKYSLGGHFFEFLSRKYSAQQINRFFVVNGERWINPLLLNKSFKQAFGKSFDHLFTLFLDSYSNRAAKQVPLKEGELIAFSRNFAGMTAHKDAVLFMTNNLVDEAKVYIVNKQTGELLSSQRDWLHGTPFLYNGGVHTLGNHTVETNAGRSVIYGLYRKGLHLAQETSGKLVQDIREDKILHYKASRGFATKNLLYENDQLVGESHSRALYSPNGEPTYFRQSRDQRQLIQGERVLYSHKGRYSKVVDFISNNVVIVGNTRYGSGLFLIKNGRSYRLHPADTVVDAKVLSTTESTATLIAMSVNGKGYQYRKIQVSLNNLKPQNPYRVRYKFEKRKSFTSLDQLLARTAPVAQNSLKSNSYSPLMQLRYSQTLPTIGLAVNEVSDGSGGTKEETSVVGGITTTFDDPLLQNSLGLSYQKFTGNSHGVSAAYTNSENRLSYSIGHSYIQDEDINGLFEFSNLSSLVLTYPLWIKGLWSQNLSLGYFYSLDTYSTPAIEDDIEQYPQLTYELNYRYNLGLGFFPYKAFSAEVTGTAFDNTSVGDLSLSGRKDFGGQNYLNLALAGGYGDRPRINLNNGSLFGSNADTVDFSSLSTDVDEDLTQAAYIRLGYFKGFNKDFYFNYIPIGLRRWGAFVNLQYNMLANVANSNSDFYEPFYFPEYQVGLTLELLLLHKFSLPFTISYGANALTAEDQDKLDPSSLLMISTQGQF